MSEHRDIGTGDTSMGFSNGHHHVVSTSSKRLEKDEIYRTRDVCQCNDDGPLFWVLLRCSNQVSRNAVILGIQRHSMPGRSTQKCETIGAERQVSRGHKFRGDGSEYHLIFPHVPQTDVFETSTAYAGSREPRATYCTQPRTIKYYVPISSFSCESCSSSRLVCLPE